MVIINRETKETKIHLELDMHSGPSVSTNTGLPFFDHMLNAMAFHGGFTLNVEARGDIEVDPHHLIEDTGLVLGDALLKTFEQTGALVRYGHAVIPMDDALSEVTIDVCRRPFLVLNADWPQMSAGNFDFFLIKEFLQALANRGGLNIHASCRYGENSHHMSEALFKALGRGLYTAFRPLSGDSREMSTKGLI
ncbi:imidazoleglycerol-phosphate dehydratase [Oceanispirochaeta sp.]|jgi:imidazoleglycerol-phosphate dehydratase|uniref:imidazoleglycerol-phosphate dehydratase n=1 Tax=Oceanispirochaeta sp. TaxID=2035350 RepID=UPI00263574F3|nr:imidazoleglycerol-phosphate dehydratase [Oceanispirochaeta sp.]MDA3956188.1 imidazoleglycerol-phosphate dehydratase [Oceanispirochaeta sp.]